ncbi:MAG: glycosyltransferase [Bdellovibrionaceae bacterium]|nr:glycosyltransferase [Pseudobdellovibrionaceae bacterium]
MQSSPPPEGSTDVGSKNHDPRVLMLGWEYPPHISGGLGTACEGLTKSLCDLKVNIDFVVPKLFGDEAARHMKLFEPSGFIRRKQEELLECVTTSITSSITTATKIRRTWEVSSHLLPYLTPEEFLAWKEEISLLSKTDQEVKWREYWEKVSLQSGAGDHYGTALFREVDSYAQRVSLIMQDESLKNSIDIIHAHDWMTFPAGLMAAQRTGRPLILHVHSIEHDRSGDGGNPHILHIEGEGLSKCHHIIAVSNYTKNQIQEKYKISPHKITVVHNGGPDSFQPLSETSAVKQEKGLYTVLFLGRMTMQKGPDYFVEAAQQVLTRIPNVLFIMAGTGDMLPRMKKRVKELKLEDHFSFPGFLKGPSVDEAFANADLYVMPSVSEPFGLTPLESIRAGTPVLISKQSGVSELLAHALKADFWDVADIADQIIGALLYPALRSDMIQMSQKEAGQITWKKSAQKILDLYQNLLTADP